MNNRDVTIADLVKLAIKRIWVIIVAMVAGGILAFYYSNLLIVPLYQSESKYLVDTTGLSEDAAKASSAQVEIQRITVLSRLLVSSYIQILDTRSFAEHVSNELAEDPRLSTTYSASSIDRFVSFDYKNDSESYRVIVHAYTPEDALIIAEYVQDESEKYLAAKKPSSKNTLYVIDNARINRVPINMNLSKYMFVGIVLSAMVAFGICLIVELNDVRVKDEKELSEILDLPTLGVVPLYNPTNEKIKRYGYYARYKTYGYKSYGYHADNTDE